MAAEFYLNDLPVTLLSPDGGTFLGRQSNELVVDGVNTIAIVVQPGPLPSESVLGPGGVKKKDAPGTRSAWARIARYPRGATVGDGSGEELLRVDWPDVDRRTQRDDYQIHDYPYRVSASKDLGTLFGPWRWQSAPTLVLDPTLQGQALALLANIRDTLHAGDIGPFLNASAIHLKEIAHAYSNDPRDKTREIRELAEDDFGQDWWGMEPVDVAAPDLRLAADDRMVECIAHDWYPILREKEDYEGGRSYYQIFLSRIDGRLQIVR